MFQFAPRSRQPSNHQGSVALDEFVLIVHPGSPGPFEPARRRAGLTLGLILCSLCAVAPWLKLLIAVYQAFYN